MTPVDRQATHALRPSRSGVGTSSIINLEYYLILKALEEAGIVVEQDNPDPKEDPNNYMNSLLGELKNKRLSMLKVKLIAKHYPWGG